MYKLWRTSFILHYKLPYNFFSFNWMYSALNYVLWLRVLLLTSLSLALSTSMVLLFLSSQPMARGPCLHYLTCGLNIRISSNPGDLILILDSWNGLGPLLESTLSFSIPLLHLCTGPWRTAPVRTRERRALGLNRLVENTSFDMLSAFFVLKLTMPSFLLFLMTDASFRHAAHIRAACTFESAAILQLPPTQTWLLEPIAQRWSTMEPEWTQKRNHWFPGQ